MIVRQAFLILRAGLAVAVVIELGPLQALANGKPIRPCAPDSEDVAVALADLKAIDQAIRALAPADDPRPLVARLKELTESRCLELMGGLAIEPTSGLSLRTYWDDGGFKHVESYLRLGQIGERMVWFPPSVRCALTRETAPDSPIVGLLCGNDEVACGAETRGWQFRAERFFELAADDQRLRGYGWREGALRDLRKEVGTDRGDSLNFDDLDCAALVTKQPARKRFSAWRQCQEARQLEQVAFPIGRTRAPTAGWLLVEGRRGHHTFCDEARAYHLATGSAYRIASCSGLALQPGGSVDHRATDRGRALTIEIGHLPVDALREAAWLLVLLDELEHRVVAGGFGIYLPKGMPVFSNTEELGSLGGSILGVSSSSADTVLSWRVLDADRLLKSGALTCSPTRLDDAEEEYAVTLLRVAEAGFVAGCPDVLPPDKSLLESPRPSAHRLDTDQSSLSLAVQAIRQGWKEAAEQTLKCSAPGSSSPPAQPSSVAPFPRPRRTSWL